MYGDDVEFSYRVRKKRCGMRVLTDIKIIHLHSKIIDDNLSKMMYCSIINDLKNIKCCIKIICKNYWQEISIF